MPLRVLALALILLVLPTAPALADHPQPAPDIAKLDYSPIGKYKGGDPIPTPDAPPTDPNPSGKWNAYDTNVYESLALPSRQAGDQKADDAPGTGFAQYGFCPQSDLTFAPYGKCANHQQEYLDHFAREMNTILGKFGVVVKRYPFTSPGINTRPGNPGNPSTPGGQAYNIAAVVPGADHPDETVIVGAHYDVTDSAPAPAWDSSEGHAEIMRMAKIMADYWTQTGTRPSATIKFVPWDQEESGTLGSLDYINKNIPPGEESKVRGYFNVDPCAGAYPAYRRGGLDQVPVQMQLADPAGASTPAVKARFDAFNAKAEKIVDQVFGRLGPLNDTVQTLAGPMPIFTPDQRSKIVTSVGGLLLFSSDYANFEGKGVPIFNLSPDYFGPHADGTPASPEGISILHSPNDNLTQINALTGPDPSGRTVSDGWAKGMEMCADIESWYMLQPEMAGAQTADGGTVAYFEALPNATVQNQQVTFDASGSYRYSDVGTRTYADGLTYAWDFGDGASGSGMSVKHGYSEVGVYKAKLTVTDPAASRTATMTVPVTVEPSDLAGPTLRTPPATDEDGTFGLEWAFAGPRDGFKTFNVEESTDFRTLFADDAEKALTERWTAELQGTPPDSAVQPWQSSDSGKPINGNKRNSGEQSYWTGANPPAPSPTNQDSLLTLKEPIDVPQEGEPTLSYWSLFRNEGDDSGQVLAALEDGNPATPLDFSPIDTVAGFFAPVSTDTSAPLDPGALTASLENRRISLSRFRGKRIVLRFDYKLGPDDRAASQPAGWYVDDIQVQAGTFAAVGSTKDTKLQVTRRATGDYAYRVRGEYADGILTASSNVERVKITNGTGTGTGGGGGGTPSCTPVRGFASVSARREGAGVRILVERRLQRPFGVEIVRQSTGRRVESRRVARYPSRTGPFSFRGAGTRADGVYVVRLSMTIANKRKDVRHLVIERRNGRLIPRRGYVQRTGCGVLKSFELSRPVFGGAGRSPLRVFYRLGAQATARVSVLRGGRRVNGLLVKARKVGNGYRVTIPARRLPRRGTYSVRLTVRRDGQKVRAATLQAQRL